MTSQPGPIDDRIDKLLATFNGERFLPEQLNSIVAQTHKNRRVLVRDDGSTDGTLAHLKAYKDKVADKLEILEDGKRNLGSVGNFSTLTEASTAPYVAFCDQEDIWRSGKMAMGWRRSRNSTRDGASKLHADLFRIWKSWTKY